MAMTSAEFRQEFEKCQPGLRRYFKAMRLQDQDINDLIQDVYLMASKTWPTFDRSRSSPSTWLHSIARHRLATYFRERKRNETNLSDYATNRGHVTIDSPTPMESDELNEQICHCLDSLPDQRSAIEMKLRGFKFREIASTLGIPEGTARSRVHYGMMQLRDCLSEYFLD